MRASIGAPSSAKSREGSTIATAASSLVILPISAASPATRLVIGGRSVLDATVRALRAAPGIGPIVLALDGVDADACLSAIEHADELRVSATAPFPDRWRAIAAALEAEPSLETVVVHEPERPLLAPESLDALLDAIAADGAVLGTAVHETVKRVVGDRVVATIPRETLHAVQAPCAFRRDALAGALARAVDERWTCRDELGLARTAGLSLRLVEGPRSNLSIQSARDARYAELRSVAAGQVVDVAAGPVETAPSGAVRRRADEGAAMSPTPGGGVAAIVLAAGSGVRMMAPMNKVFLRLGGRPILGRTLEAFSRIPAVDVIVLVAAPPDRELCERLVRDSEISKPLRLVAGGPTRHASEYSGLLALDDDIASGRVDVVMVHDAVRPFVNRVEVDQLVATAREVGAAVPMIPGGDRLVTLAEDGTVQNVEDGLWLAQTPQVFRARLVLEAHREAAADGFVGTDTSSVVERAGHEVGVVVGRRDNIKLTTADDMVLAELIAEG